MEVHHPHIEKKKFKHYLWEFLMLFLAVFCGFLAENIRENSVERKREREYIKLLIEDLQTDSAVLNYQIPRMKQAVRGLDTLISETYAYIQGKADTRLMYYTYHHYCRNVFNVGLSQRTINQLKNSGNMRLIHNKQAVEIILAGEIGFQQLEEGTKFYRIRQEDPSSFGLKIFDFSEYQKANTNPDGSTNSNEDGFLRLTYQPPLNTTDPAYLKEFAARVGYYRNSFAVYIANFEKSLPGLVKGINDLKKNYNL